MGSELVLLTADEVAKAEASQIKLACAMRIVVNGGSCGTLKRNLEEIAVSRNGDANYYRVNYEQAKQLLRKAKLALWKQNKESPKETFAKHAARLEELYKQAKEEGNKSLALAVEDRLMALHGVDKESMLQRAGEKSARLGQRLDAALGNLSRAIGALINENVPTAEQTALEDGSQHEPTAIDDSEL